MMNRLHFTGLAGQTLAGLALAGWALSVVANLRAQGQVNLGNNSSSLVLNGRSGLPVTSADGVKAALYVAPPSSSSFFMVGALADVGMPPGAIAGGAREVPFPPGAAFRAQVRAWFGGFSSYEAALASGAWFGQSAIIEMVAGGGGEPPIVPPSLTANGLQGFLVPHFLTQLPYLVTLAATSVTSTSAVLNASVTPWSWAVGVLFEWGTTNYDNTTTLQNLVSASNPIPVQASIMGLQPGATYHFRPKVLYDSAGILSGTDGSFVWNNTMPVVVPSFNPLSGVITLQFAATVRQSYYVQVATNLLDWTTQGVAQDLQDGMFKFENPVTPGGRFYRVLLP